MLVLLGSLGGLNGVDEHGHDLEQVALDAVVGGLEDGGVAVLVDGEGKIDFIQPGTFDWLSWVEERYYFVVTVNGEENTCWGRKDSVTGNDLKPSDEVDFYDIQVSSWSQWDHCWKFAGEMNGANVHILIDSNKDGVMTHVVTKK